MLRRLPPLNALKAFEAAARHESFTRAAEELCVTQGAVSHQVKALETELGLKLFIRERQRLVITELGREYLAVLRDAFDRIALGTEQLRQRQTSGVLTVSTSPDFAAKWLVNRLGHFLDAHPEIDLRVSATMQHVDFAREDVDVAVRHGEGNWPGLEAVDCRWKSFRCQSKVCMSPRRSRACLSPRRRRRAGSGAPPAALERLCDRSLAADQRTLEVVAQATAPCRKSARVRDGWPSGR